MKPPTCHNCGELMEVRTRSHQSFGLNVCLAFLGGLLLVYGYIALRFYNDLLKACLVWIAGALLIFCPWFIGNKKRNVWYCKKCRYFYEIDGANRSGK
jgi:hypothetical protein